jgi:drug/metabolite transporter (DMT)-like permease
MERQRIGTDRGGLGRGVVLMAASLAMFLLAGVLARDLSARYPVGEVLFLRFLLSLIVVVPFALVTAGWAALRSANPGLQAVRAACGVAAAGIFYAASQYLTFAALVTVSYTMPLFVTLLSRPVLGERVGPHRALLVAGGFCGVVLVLAPASFGTWSLAALGMAVLNAVCALGARKLAATDVPATTSLLFVIVGACVTLPLAACSFSPIAPADVVGFLILGVASGLAVILNVAAFRHGPAAVLVPIDYFGIVAATAIGFFAYREEPTTLAIAGSGLIAVTGWAQLWVARRDLPGDGRLVSSGADPEPGVQRT